jgi:DNA-binding response OmpR family regulator
VTVYSTDFENIIFSLMVGASGYLLKPISIEQLKTRSPVLRREAS